jgi:hypothetical protein
MFEADSPSWIAVVVASVYLLQNSTKDLCLCRWLSPFSLGWVIASLIFIYPFVLKGSWPAVGAAYLLMGALILNTLVLSAMSRLPHQLVAFESKGLETVGLMFLGFVSIGFGLLIKSCFTFLQRLLVKRQNVALMAWSST